MAGVLPTKLLKFDDGSGTYPTDMTSRLDLNSISVQPYGRADEQTTASTTELTITLNNNDGALTSGASLVTVGQGVRLTYTVGSTTVDQFTGRVASAVLSWEGGPAKKANLVVTAYDVTAELGRRQMRSMLEQEILLDSPTAYYTLGEADGSTSAGDTSGNGAAPLAVTGSGTALAFGVDDGGTGTAVQFSSGGQYLTGPTFTETTPGVYSLAFRVTLPTFAGSYTILNVGKILVSMFSGVLQVSANGGDVGSSVLSANTAHDILITCDGSFVRLYVDGVLNNSGTIFPTSTPSPVGTFAGFNDGFAGSIANLAIFDNVTLSITDAANFYDFSAGSGTETTDARLTRLASYVGITAATSAPSGQIMSTQSTSGSSALDALEAVAAAEGGLLYVDGSGNLRMQGRYYRGQQTTAALALTGRDLDPASTAITLDIQQVVNQVTATRTGGAQQVAVNQTSIDTAGAFPQSVELAVAADSDALGYAQWTVAKHASPAPRMASVTFNMFTSPNREAILGAEVGDRVSLSSMPSQLFSGFGDVTLEGWADSLSVSSGTVTWTRTANLLPWTLFEAFILNSSTYGVLNGAVPIGY